MKLKSQHGSYLHGSDITLTNSSTELGTNIIRDIGVPRLFAFTAINRDFIRLSENLL